MKAETRLSLVALAAITALLLAVPALAEPPAGSEPDAEPDLATDVEASAKTGQPDARPTAGSAPSLRSLVVVRDAETGELRAPNAGEWQRLASSLDPLSRSDAGLERIYYPNGTVGVALDDRFHHLSVAHRHGAAGEAEFSCTHDAQTATDLLLGDPADAEGEVTDRQEVRDDM